MQEQLKTTPGLIQLIAESRGLDQLYAVLRRSGNDKHEVIVSEIEQLFQNGNAEYPDDQNIAFNRAKEIDILSKATTIEELKSTIRKLGSVIYWDPDSNELTKLSADEVITRLALHALGERSDTQLPAHLIKQLETILLLENRNFKDLNDLLVYLKTNVQGIQGSRRFYNYADLEQLITNYRTFATVDSKKKEAEELLPRMIRNIVIALHEPTVARVKATMSAR